MINNINFGSTYIKSNNNLNKTKIRQANCAHQRCCDSIELSQSKKTNKPHKKTKKIPARTAAILSAITLGLGIKAGYSLPKDVQQYDYLNSAIQNYSNAQEGTFEDVTLDAILNKKQAQDEVAFVLKQGDDVIISFLNGENHQAGFVKNLFDLKDGSLKKYVVPEVWVDTDEVDPRGHSGIYDLDLSGVYDDVIKVKEKNVNSSDDIELSRYIDADKLINAIQIQTGLYCQNYSSFEDWYFDVEDILDEQLTPDLDKNEVLSALSTNRFALREYFENN